jgi:RNA polymerase sigma-70 factor (ECF subfamily)
MIAAMIRAKPLIQSGGRPHQFGSTHWSVVLAATQPGDPGNAAALEALCKAYWFPLYAYVRRQGCNPEEAADLTQEFFARLLTTNGLATVRREKGKFRSFLLASIKNLMAKEWQRGQCIKRGGEFNFVSLDKELVEGRYLQDTMDEQSPDKLFDRKWVETILHRALDQLRLECDQGGKLHRFEQLKLFLTVDKDEDTLSAAAARLGITVPAVKGMIFRLRVRLRELIRKEVAATVPGPDAVEEEIRELFATYGG